MTIILENGGAQNLVTIYGSSTDAKPLNYADGSVFIETDTLTTYIYDEKNETWRELA